MSHLTQFRKLNIPKCETGQICASNEAATLKRHCIFNYFSTQHYNFDRNSVVLVLPALPPCRLEWKIGASQQKNKNSGFLFLGFTLLPSKHILHPKPQFLKFLLLSGKSFLSFLVWPPAIAEVTKVSCINFFDLSFYGF